LMADTGGKFIISREVNNFSFRRGCVSSKSNTMNETSLYGRAQVVNATLIRQRGRTSSSGIVMLNGNPPLQYVVL
jgi:hypothetical protein